MDADTWHLEVIEHVPFPRAGTYYFIVARQLLPHRHPSSNFLLISGFCYRIIREQHFDPHLPGRTTIHG